MVTVPPRTGNYGPKVPVGSLSPFIVDHFTITVPGTVAFALSALPLVPADVLFFVNGVLYEAGADFNVAGQIATWTNTLFLLTPPDKVLVYYESS